MKKNRSLSLAALSAGMMLGANFTPTSAQAKTAFSDYTGADPMANNYSLNIDTGVDSGISGGGLPQGNISGEGSEAQQQGQAAETPQLDVRALPKAEPGTEAAAT